MPDYVWKKLTGDVDVATREGYVVMSDVSGVLYILCENIKIPDGDGMFVEDCFPCRREDMEEVDMQELLISIEFGKDRE